VSRRSLETRIGCGRQKVCWEDESHGNRTPQRGAAVLHIGTHRCVMPGRDALPFSHCILKASGTGSSRKSTSNCRGGDAHNRCGVRPMALRCGWMTIVGLTVGGRNEELGLTNAGCLFFPWPLPDGVPFKSRLQPSGPLTTTFASRLPQPPRRSHEGPRIPTRRISITMHGASNPPIL